MDLLCLFFRALHFDEDVSDVCAMQISQYQLNIALDFIYMFIIWCLIVLIHNSFKIILYIVLFSWIIIFSHGNEMDGLFLFCYILRNWQQTTSGINVRLIKKRNISIAKTVLTMPVEKAVIHRCNKKACTFFYKETSN